MDLGTSQAQIHSATALEELTEGTTTTGMATVGQLRANSAQLDQQIKNLETDSLSSRFGALVGRMLEWQRRIQFLAPFRAADLDVTRN